MARYKDKEMARQMRVEGKSYSEIKEVLKVSKSTLSLWLRDMPLSDTQIRALRDWNPKRIERYRATMKEKYEKRLTQVYAKVVQDIGTLTKRELLISGFFLYWGEGTKATRSMVAFSNTDPKMIQFFLKWLSLLGIEKNQVKVRLHLYADMDIKKETDYWSHTLELPLVQFHKPYVKTSLFSNITYKKGHGHGTCNVLFGNAALWEYIMMTLKYLGEAHKGV